MVTNGLDFVLSPGPIKGSLAVSLNGHKCLSNLWWKNLGWSLLVQTAILTASPWWLSRIAKAQDVMPGRWMVRVSCEWSVKVRYGQGVRANGDSDLRLLHAFALIYAASSQAAS